MPSCRSYRAFDAQLSQYINGLYLRGDPMYKAANVLSGFKRLMPQCRRSLEISALYYNNWAKTTPRKRALPLKPEWVKAFGVYAAVVKQPLLGLLAVLGFLGLFRVTELLELRSFQLTFVSESSLLFIFSDSKGAKLKGCPETIRIRDVQLIRALKVRAGAVGETGLLFPFTYTEVAAFLKDAAGNFELPVEQVTTHCLRRGGATWHFTLFASYDVTAEHGRWRHVKDCRLYVNAAMADLAEVALSAEAKAKIVNAAKAWPAVLARCV